MKDKVSFLKEKTDLAQKIVLLYQPILDFEKSKAKNRVVINSKNKDARTKSKIS
jgi:hypothetical protein